MSEIQTVPETHITVLEILAKSGQAMTVEQIEKAVGDRFPAKGAIANLRSLGRIKSKEVPGSKYIGYVPSTAGKELIKNKSKIKVTPYKPKDWSKTEKKKKAAKKTAEPIIPLLPQINVSQTADNLMDHISAVIQENGAYREAILKSCQQMAAILGMKVVPINDGTPNEQQ